MPTPDRDVIAQLRAELKKIKADYNVLSKSFRVLAEDYRKIRGHLGDWHNWVQKVEGAPKKLVTAAKKFLGI